MNRWVVYSDGSLNFRPSDWRVEIRSLPVRGILSLINSAVYSGRVSSVARGKWISVSQT